MVIIIVAVALAVIIVLMKRRNLKNNVKTANMDKSSPPAITTQDHNCSTIKMKETVKNKSYETTISALQNQSVNTPEYPNNDPETGQSTSPLYTLVQKNEVTEEDNQEDESAPPSYDPLYAAVQGKPKRDEVQHVPECHLSGYEDLDTVVQTKKKMVLVSNDQQDDDNEFYPEHIYSAVQKKKKKVQVSDKPQDDETECYPEHVYSSVQKKIKNKPSKKTFPLDELDPELESPAHDGRSD